MPDVIDYKFAKKYGRSGNNGDDLAEVLSKYLTDPETGKTDPIKFQQIADANMVSTSKWTHLNQGQKRMLMGNVLRGQIRRGGKVTIGEITLDNKD